MAIAKELSGKGLYLAYNKAIQTDAARKFPSHVDCKTSHSIAYRVLAYRIKDRVRTLSIFDITRYVDIKRIYSYEENDIAFLVLKLLRVFVNSDRNEIDQKFRLSRVFEEVAGNNGEETRAIINYVIDRAAEYWQACIERGSTLPIEHDFYLKMYQLSNPDLSSVYDFILFDECQDANPVLLDILLKQKCQKIYVGDDKVIGITNKGSNNGVVEKHNINADPVIGKYGIDPKYGMYDLETTAQRAESKMGKSSYYDLWFHNCHNFTNWCRTGVDYNIFGGKADQGFIFKYKTWDNI
ncbi:MAG: hypothetical protein EBY20_06010 [Alphaproteobacteria bacterium]|nr:hypothetical protein [Alphaproteobacteria bacterium]